MTRLRHRIRLATVVTAVTLGVSACSGGSLAAESPPTSATAASTDAHPIPRGTTVAFVGDSIVHGLGVQPSEAWPELVGDTLGWDSVNLGCDGGGFIAPGACATPLGERAAEVAEAAPEVIIVSSSRNDLGYPVDDVVAAIAPAVRAVAAAAPDALIIGVSNVWGPEARPESLDDYNTALAAAVLEAGGRFLSYQDPLRTSATLMLPDEIHPTPVGQQAIADAFLSAARAAGLAD